MKRIGCAILAVLMLGMMLVGCGPVDSESNLIYVSKKGQVQTVDVEEFDKSYYSEEEFKTFGVTVELREVKKFRVALTDLGTQAVKVIKLITELTDLSLETVMSKAEQLPFVIYESAYQFEAEEILCKLENIGATVEIDEL